MTRKFYPREINLIKEIVSDIRRDAHHQYILLNAFKDIFFYNKGTIAYNEGFLLFSYEDFKNKTAEILDIEQEVIERALLIKELKDANYIYFILDHEDPEFPYGSIAKGKTPLSKKIPSDIAEILDLLKYRVIVSKALIALLADDFKTLEEQTLEEAKKQTVLARKQVEEAKNQSSYAKEQSEEAKKQSHSAKVSLIISAIALLVAIASPFVSKQINCRFPCDDSTSTIAGIVNEIKDIMNSISIQQFEASIQTNQEAIIKLLQPKQEEPKCNQPKKATTTKTTKKATKKQPLYLPLDTINCDGKEYMIVEKVK